MPPYPPLAARVPRCVPEAPAPEAVGFGVWGFGFRVCRFIEFIGFIGFIGRIGCMGLKVLIEFVGFRVYTFSDGSA